MAYDEDMIGCEHNDHYPCKSCIDDFITPMAQMGVLGHLWMSFWCLLNFEIAGVFVELTWAVTRIFGIGDYGPNGWFSKLGINVNKRTIT